jgi:predicted CXXCH cytochrome family protein
MEDCLICHNPHGAVADNLLNTNEPFICLQCHQPHFHSGLDAIDGDYTPAGLGAAEDFPPYGELSGTSAHDSFKRVMLTKCSQCHQAIHGSDLPAQSIPGQGRSLNR